MAGGHKPPDGGFGGIYVNTSHAKLGDAGSESLPKTGAGPTWSAGMSYEVTWTIEANHAGGYLYRLAPADGPLNEETFNKMPLEFVGQQGFRWAGGPAHGGSEHFFNGTYVSVGTVPTGSKWSLNPVPRYDHGEAQEAKCHQGGTMVCATNTTPVLARSQASVNADVKGVCQLLVCFAQCTGMTDGSNASPALEIVDRVMIPKGLKPGAYVLGWRWDCEESNQIWQSCSDVTIA
jgi:hypothetical protein